MPYFFLIYTRGKKAWTYTLALGHLASATALISLHQLFPVPLRSHHACLLWDHLSNCSLCLEHSSLPMPMSRSLIFREYLLFNIYYSTKSPWPGVKIATHHSFTAQLHNTEPANISLVLLEQGPCVSDLPPHCNAYHSTSHLVGAQTRLWTNE